MGWVRLVAFTIQLLGGLGLKVISYTDEERWDFLQRSRRVAPRAYGPESGAGIGPARMAM